MDVEPRGANGAQRRQLVDAEPVEVGPVDRDRARNRQRLEASFDHIPGQQTLLSKVRRHDEDREGSARRYSPLGIADDDGRGLQYAIDRERLKSRAFVEG